MEKKLPSGGFLHAHYSVSQMYFWKFDASVPCVGHASILQTTPKLIKMTKEMVFKKKLTVNFKLVRFSYIIDWFLIGLLLDCTTQVNWVFGQYFERKK